MTLARMRDYELVMILSPEATEAEAAETVSRITDLISEGGGNVAEQENWGVRRLAYPIRRFIEGNYFIARCTMEAQAAVELDNTLNSAQDVLRHLVLRLEKAEIAAMEKQAERDRAAREETERRAQADRDARARDEARRLAEAEASAAPRPTADPADAITPVVPPVEANTESEPEADEVSAVQVEANAESEPEADEVSAVQVEANAESEPEADEISAVQVEADAESEPEADEISTVQVEANAESEPEADEISTVQVEADAESEPEADDAGAVQAEAEPEPAGEAASQDPVQAEASTEDVEETSEELDTSRAGE